MPGSASPLRCARRSPVTPSSEVSSEQLVPLEYRAIARAHAVLTTHSGRSRLYVHRTSPVSGSRPSTSPPSPVTTVDGFSSPVSFSGVCTTTGDWVAPLRARHTSASVGGSAVTSGNWSHVAGPVTDVVARASLNAQVSTDATIETTAISATAT